MYFHKMPKVIQKFHPNYTWHKSRERKVLYITFDDGPIPEVTDFALEALNQFDAKATFFCVGDNVQKYRKQFKAIVEKGHVIANHTFNHMNGWETDANEYIKNISDCEKIIGDVTKIYTQKMFRPPYGRIKKRQYELLKADYEVIMWDVLTGDFDRDLDKEKCLEESIQATNNGSIIVFHDSIKAKENMMYALPRFLAHFSQLGYTFEAL